MRTHSSNWKLGIAALLCAALVAGDAFSQDGRGKGGGGGGGGRGGGGQRGGGGGGGVSRGGGGGGGGNGGSQQRGPSSSPNRGGGGGGAIRGPSGGGNRGPSSGAIRGPSNPGGENRGVPGDGNRGRSVAPGGGNRRPETPDVQHPPRGSDRQDRRTMRPDFDGRNRTPGVDGRNGAPGSDGRNRAPGNDGRNRTPGNDGRNRTPPGSDGNLGNRDRDGGLGNVNGNWRDRNRDWRDSRRGDRDWDRDWNRDRNGWANSGWNGGWGNRHNGWRRGSWGWNNWGYRPWWGGYGGWGRGSNLGLALLGLGLGYNNWGWGGYGYPYGYSYGNQWGYGSWLNSGYYYNPYYSTPLTLGSTVIDYSQPLYNVAVDDSTIVQEPDSAAVMTDFDAAREAFRLGDYNTALDGVHRALQTSPNDTALHEFRALVLFAQGNYREAAATLHAVLANGPGWDWATLSALYPSVDVYTGQLRALEDYTRSNPESADGLFVLGYHYMTEGYQDAGIKKFERVVQLEPKDLLAQRIVESAVADSSAITSTTEAPPAEALPTATLPAADAAANGTPVNVDLIRGDWHSTQEDGSKFNLSLGADNQFTWTFAQGDKSSSMRGQYSVSNDLLILEPDSGPPMIGRVADADNGGFRFRMVGTPEEDPGLQFSR